MEKLLFIKVLVNPYSPMFILVINDDTSDARASCTDEHLLEELSTQSSSSLRQFPSHEFYHSRMIDFLNS